MTPEADVVVIGAGVVGLAAAAALARAGRSVVILERHDRVAQEATTHSSEVIHAGLYYPPGSKKAVLCSQGRDALYARCGRLGIPHRRTGKLVAAAEEGETEGLERLLERGRANGAPGLELLSGPEAARREPALRAVAALLSPASGVVDAYALSLSYAAEAEADGAVLLLRAEVVSLAYTGSMYRVDVQRGGGDGESPGGGVESIRCTALVNAAGLAADRVAERAGLDVDARGYRLHLCKGDYFSLAPGAPLRLSHLVYPVPRGAGLGIHATLDLGGRIRFGPDAEYVDRVRYDVDPAKAEAFAEAVRRYLPAVDAAWLAPDQAGVRARLAAPGEAFRDFVVAEESDAGLPGFVNLLGIESPGLTAAPAIADRVVELLRSL